MSIALSTPLTTLLFSTFAVLAVSGCNVSLDVNRDATTHTEQTTVDPSGIRNIVITTENGSVDVIAMTGDIAVSALITETENGKASYTADVVGDTLEIEGICDAGWLDRCEVAFDITAPAELDVTVDTDNGDVTIVDVAGTLDVSTDNGDIDGSGLAADSVQMTTDNGRVDVRFITPPGSVDAKSDNGRVDVQLPSDDEAYDVEASSDNGTVNVDVVNDPAAQRSITAASDNGDVRVHYAERSAG